MQLNHNTYFILFKKPCERFCLSKIKVLTVISLSHCSGLHMLNYNIQAKSPSSPVRHAIYILIHARALNYALKMQQNGGGMRHNTTIRYGAAIHEREASIIITQHFWCSPGCRLMTGMQFCAYCTVLRRYLFDTLK